MRRKSYCSGVRPVRSRSRRARKVAAGNSGIWLKSAARNAARGSLSDWIVIEDGKIANYQVITRIG